jgi:hypothetical protein
MYWYPWKIEKARTIGFPLKGFLVAREFRQVAAKRVRHTRELQKLSDAREINFDGVVPVNA